MIVLSGATWGAYAQSPPSLTIRWTDASSNEQGFTIDRGPATGGPFAEIGATATNVAKYTDATVTAGTVYCYRVRAYTERMVNSKPERMYSSYSNVLCGSSVPPPDGSPRDLMFDAQEALSSAVEQLGIAAGKIADATKLLP